MKIIIGAKGFLGQYCEAQYSQHEKVVAMSFRPGREKEFEKELIDLLVEYRPAAIINAAASQATGDDLNSIQELISSNVTLPAILASNICKYSKETVLMTFGTSWEFLNEDISPFNLYAASKSSSECVLRHYALAGVKICYLRLYDVYGENDNRNKIVNLIADAINSNEGINMSGGEQLMKLVHVSDVFCAINVAIDKVLMSDQRGVFSYDVCSGEAHSLKEISAIMCESAGLNASKFINFGFYPYRERERFTLKTSRILPEWIALKSLEVGLCELIKSRLG